MFLFLFLFWRTLALMVGWPFTDCKMMIRPLQLRMTMMMMWICLVKRLRKRRRQLRKGQRPLRHLERRKSVSFCPVVNSLLFEFWFYTNTWHWFSAYFILSWEIIRSVGCEAMGWWNWHEKAWRSSEISSDGRAILGCMYVVMFRVFIFFIVY